MVTSFGSAQEVSWSGRGGAAAISLKVLGCPESLTGSYKFMFQKLPDIREGDCFSLGNSGGCNTTWKGLEEVAKRWLGCRASSRVAFEYVSPQVSSGAPVSAGT